MGAKTAKIQGNSTVTDTAKKGIGETQPKHRGLNPLGQIRDRCNPGAEEFLDGYSIGQAVMALSIVAIGRMVSRRARTVF